MTHTTCPIHGDKYERSECTTESVKLIFQQGEVTVKFVGNIIFGMHLCNVKPQHPLGANIASYMGNVF